MAALLAGDTIDRHRASELTGVSEANAWRQLRAISAKLPGAHVVGLEGRRGSAVRYDFAGQLGATPKATLVAACLGMSTASLFEDTPYAGEMRAAFERLVKSSRDAELFVNSDRKFAFVSGGGDLVLEKARDVLDTIVDALLEGKRLKLGVNHVSSAPQQHSVEPWSLVVYQHQLYLIARGKDGVRAIRCSRITRATKLKGEFTYPTRDDYDPAAIFREVIGIHIRHPEPATKVRVRLGGNWAKFARTHRWHRTQSVVSDHGATLVLELSVRPCPEVVAWILSMGADAKVLAPPELRDRITRQVEGMARRYAPKRPTA